MTRSKLWLYAAAGLSVLAGLLHLLVMPEHFDEWLGYGLFFLVVALAQLVYAVLLLRRPSSASCIRRCAWTSKLAPMTPGPARTSSPCASGTSR